jgi:hypothetical protein
VNSASRNVRWTLPGLKSPRRATARERHVAVEDDVGRIDGMRVVGIEGVRAILPDIDVSETFATELLFECVGVHDSSVPTTFD